MAARRLKLFARPGKCGSGPSRVRGGLEATGCRDPGSSAAIPSGRRSPEQEESGARANAILPQGGT
jgi:hypothetical protein